MIRIAHLSDIHFGGENAAAVAGASAWLTDAVPDLTVITGDLTRFGQPDEFARAAEWVASLNKPLLMIPGNHDTPYTGLWERLTAPFGRYERAFARPAKQELWSGPLATVAGVNTARGIQVRWNWSKGAITSAQVDHALEALAGGRPGALGVIACHHPLAEMAGGPMTGRVRGGESAARRLCESRSDLVLTGHIHAPFAMALPYGDGHTYAVGASTLSVRERGVPAGFNLIEADEAAIAVTALGWSGSNFESWRTWTFPRRAPTLGR